MKQFTKDEIDELISDLKRITFNIHRISLRECYIESLLETEGFHYKYYDCECEKNKVGNYNIWNDSTELMFQYQCSKSRLTKCIIITKK